VPAPVDDDPFHASGLLGAQPFHPCDDARDAREYSNPVASGWFRVGRGRIHQRFGFDRKRLLRRCHLSIALVLSSVLCSCSTSDGVRNCLIGNDAE